MSAPGTGKPGGWAKSTDEIGWETYRRGNCTITVPPGGPTPQVPARLFAPACHTEHPSLAAAKRAASDRLERGW